MNESQHLAFIPLFLYGIAIADVINHWRSYLTRKNFFLPYVLSALMLVEFGIFSIYEYLQLISSLTSNNYGAYLTHLIPPIIFLAMCKVITPDQGVETKQYFMANISLLFSLAALFNLSHFIFDYGTENPYLLLARILSISLFLTLAYTRKIALVYVIFALYVVRLILRIL